MRITETKIRKENSALNTRMLLNQELDCLNKIGTMLIGLGIPTPTLKKSYIKASKRWYRDEYIKSLMKKRRLRNK